MGPHSLHPRVTVRVPREHGQASTCEDNLQKELNNRKNMARGQLQSELSNKACACGPRGKGILDMTNENVQFCVSWFTCGVAKVGMKRFVDAWNNIGSKVRNCSSSLLANIYRPGVMLIFFKQRRTWAEPTLLIPLC